MCYNNNLNGGKKIIDREIFKQDLPVNTTSAYLLICAFLEAGVEPALDLLRSRWGATPEELNQALAELTELNIITRQVASAAENPFYQINPAFRWGPAPPWPAPKGLPVFNK